MTDFFYFICVEKHAEKFYLNKKKIEKYKTKTKPKFSLFLKFGKS